MDDSSRRPSSKGRIRYDAVLKDLFQRDHPLLLDRFTHGVAIRETLNIEFHAVEERRPDLIFLMATGNILHLEFQSSNDPAMVYRMGRYCAMIAERYRRRAIQQIVLYTGQERMRMPAEADLGLTKLAYELHDIREFDSNEFLRSGRRGDIALALLASGGERNLHRILLRAARLAPHDRSRLLTQLGVLIGLRKLNDEIKMEVAKMGTAIYIKDHFILREVAKEWLREGEAKGRSEGRTEGMSDLLTQQLRAKFGPVPRWAQDRLRRATPVQMGRWATKLITAETLEGVIGRRR